MSFIDLDFSDDELSALFSAPLSLDGSGNREEEVEASDELVGLTRKLASQYIDVLASFARDSFRGNAEVDTHGVSGAIEALTRLAESTGDTDLLRVLQQLAKLVDSAAAAVDSNARVRDLLRVQMRHWVLRFADCLDGEDRARMRQLVLYDKTNVPLFDQLARIKGIGPRRIQRMYCAGLFTVETVVQSTPDDIASVTGIPLNLARRIHAETTKYASEVKQTSVQALDEAIHQFVQILPRFNRDDAPLILQVRQSLDTLTRNLDTSPWGGAL